MNLKQSLHEVYLKEEKKWFPLNPFLSHAFCPVDLIALCGEPVV